MKFLTFFFDKIKKETFALTFLMFVICLIVRLINYHIGSVLVIIQDPNRYY